MDWIEIFKTGTHTDSAGNTSEWTQKDLQEIVSLYDPHVHEAPIVIGHPETDSPAYGWVEKLKVEGGKLLMLPGQVVDQFKGWVRQGLYKKVSIALYPDLGLRHVGFLGAMPPAIKGLRQAAFGDEKIGWVIESAIPIPQSAFSEGDKKAQEARSKKWGHRNQGRRQCDQAGRVGECSG